MTRSSAAPEPSMDEILASIRRIIESGDEREDGASAAPTVRTVQVERLAPGGTTAGKLIARLAPESEERSDAGKTAERGASREEAFSLEDDDLARRLQEELAADDFDQWPSLHSAPAASAAVSSGSPGRLSGDAYADGPFRPANSDSPRMHDFREAVLQDAVSPRLEDAHPIMSDRAGDLVGSSFDALAEAVREGQLRSMEDMAQDMLRPMLQDWLDENLPKLVERLVREEIERVARGPRRPMANA